MFFVAQLSLLFSKFFLSVGERLTRFSQVSDGRNCIYVEFVGGPQDGSRFCLVLDSLPAMLEVEAVTEYSCKDHTQDSVITHIDSFFYENECRVDINGINLYRFREDLVSQGPDI